MFFRILKGVRPRLRIILRKVLLPLSIFSNNFFLRITQQQPEFFINTEVPNRFELKYLVNSPRSILRAQKEHTWEPELLDLIYSLSTEPNGSPSLFIDVGANVGTYSLIAGKLGWNVLAIEPNYANSYLLSRNIQANGLGERILQIKFAVSDSSRVTQLLHHKEVEGGNSGATIDNFYSGQNDNVSYAEAILTFTLDDLLALTEFRPKLLKIDTDGNELHVLKGASNLLRTESLCAILIEVSSVAEKKEVVGLLSSFGFNLITTKAKSSSIYMQNLVFTRTAS
jgi:FkbM family methyltransferase